MSEKFTHSIYLHISNGGVSFSVDKNPKFGPTIIIEATSFGHKLHTMKLHVSKRALMKLAEMFEIAANDNYGDGYCVAAEATRGE